MRSQKRFLGNIDSSFLSCEKDTEMIIRKLFVESEPYSSCIKKLLLINNKDCLDAKNNIAYETLVKETSVADLVDEGYIRLCPKLNLGENEDVMNYIIITYDNFIPAENPYYRDCVLMIDVICNSDCWDIGNFRQRPIKIIGYIDGILNKTRLTGLGTLEFAGCNEIILNDSLAGYCLMYRTVHGDDDSIEAEEEE